MSLDGLTFADESPGDLNALLGIESLNSVIVDPYLYDSYSTEFDAFDATEGKMVSIATPDCDGDGVVSIADANCTSDSKLDRLLAASGTLRGDLDGVGGVQFGDFNEMAKNIDKSPAVYTDGDFDKNGIVGFPDFILLARNIGQGSDFTGAVAAAAVPEPSSLVLLLIVTVSMLSLRRSRLILR